MPFPLFRAAAVAAALCCVALPGRATAQDRAPEQDTTNGVAPLKPVMLADKPAAGPSPTAPIPTAPASASEAQHYCDNIAAVAAEARFAWQTKKLNELQAQVAGRVAELEKKQAALEASLAKRDDIMKRTAATLIAVYAKMEPDAAAAQLSLLEDQTAAAVLAQLSPRQASAILDEIKPERASQLVGAMTNLPQADAKADAPKTDGKKS